MHQVDYFQAIPTLLDSQGSFLGKCGYTDACQEGRIAAAEAAAEVAMTKLLLGRNATKHGVDCRGPRPAAS